MKKVKTSFKQSLSVIFVMLLLNTFSELNAQSAAFYDITDNIKQGKNSKGGDKVTIGISLSGAKALALTNMRLVAVNKKQQVIGQCDAPQSNHRYIFVWAPDTFCLIGSYLYGTAEGINEDGDIVYNYLNNGTPVGAVAIRKVNGSNEELYSERRANAGWMMTDISGNYVSANVFYSSDALPQPMLGCLNLAGGNNPLSNAGSILGLYFGGDGLQVISSGIWRGRIFNIQEMKKGASYNPNDPSSTVNFNSNKEVALKTAVDCSLPSGVRTIKADDSNPNTLVYGAGDSYGYDYQSFMDILGKVIERERFYWNASSMLLTNATDDDLWHTYDVLDRVFGYINDVNAHGITVGGYLTEYKEGQTGGSLKSFAKGFASCETHLDLFPDASSEARGINDGNFIVGNRVNGAWLYRMKDICTYDPERWSDLTDYGKANNYIPSNINVFKLRSANDISNNYDIIGMFYPQSNTGNVDAHGYLMRIDPCDPNNKSESGLTASQPGKFGSDPINPTFEIEELMRQQSVNPLNRIYSKDISSDYLPTSLNISSAFSGPDQGTYKWLVKSKPKYGPNPDQEVLLASNGGEKYLPNSDYKISSATVSLPYRYGSHLVIKYWADIEAGYNDYVKILYKEAGSLAAGENPNIKGSYKTLGVISASTDPNAAYSKLTNPMHNTSDPGWAYYVIDVSDIFDSKAFNNSGQNPGISVQFAFQFLSNGCYQGKGVLVKSVEIYQFDQDWISSAFNRRVETLLTTVATLPGSTLALQNPAVALELMLKMPSALNAAELADAAQKLDQAYKNSPSVQQLTPTQTTQFVEVSKDILKKGGKVKLGAGLITIGFTLGSIYWDYLNTPETQTEVELEQQRCEVKTTSMEMDKVVGFADDETIMSLWNTFMENNILGAFNAKQEGDDYKLSSGKPRARTKSIYTLIPADPDLVSLRFDKVKNELRTEAFEYSFSSSSVDHIVAVIDPITKEITAIGDALGNFEHKDAYSYMKAVDAALERAEEIIKKNIEDYAENAQQEMVDLVEERIEEVYQEYLEKGADMLKKNLTKEFKKFAKSLEPFDPCSKNKNIKKPCAEYLLAYKPGTSKNTDPFDISSLSHSLYTSPIVAPKSSKKTITGVNGKNMKGSTVGRSNRFLSSDESEIITSHFLFPNKDDDDEMSAFNLGPEINLSFKSGFIPMGASLTKAYREEEKKHLNIKNEVSQKFTPTELNQGIVLNPYWQEQNRIPRFDQERKILMGTNGAFDLEVCFLGTDKKEYVQDVTFHIVPTINFASVDAEGNFTTLKSEQDKSPKESSLFSYEKNTVMFFPGSRDRAQDALFIVDNDLSKSYERSRIISCQDMRAFKLNGTDLNEKYYYSRYDRWQGYQVLIDESSTALMIGEEVSDVLNRVEPNVQGQTSVPGGLEFYSEFWRTFFYNIPHMGSKNNSIKNVIGDNASPDDYTLSLTQNLYKHNYDRFKTMLVNYANKANQINKVIEIGIFAEDVNTYLLDVIASIYSDNTINVDIPNGDKTVKLFHNIQLSIRIVDPVYSAHREASLIQSVKTLRTFENVSVTFINTYGDNTYLKTLDPALDSKNLMKESLELDVSTLRNHLLIRAFSVGIYGLKVFKISPLVMEYILGLDYIPLGAYKTDYKGDGDMSKFPSSSTLDAEPNIGFFLGYSTKSSVPECIAERGWGAGTVLELLFFNYGKKFWERLVDDNAQEELDNCCNVYFMKTLPPGQNKQNVINSLFDEVIK